MLFFYMSLIIKRNSFAFQKNFLQIICSHGSPGADSANLVNDALPGDIVAGF